PAAARAVAGHADAGRHEVLDQPPVPAELRQPRAAMRAAALAVAARARQRHPHRPVHLRRRRTQGRLVPVLAPGALAAAAARDRRLHERGRATGAGGGAGSVIIVGRRRGRRRPQFRQLLLQALLVVLQFPDPPVADLHAVAQRRDVALQAVHRHPQPLDLLVPRVHAPTTLTHLLKTRAGENAGTVNSYEASVRSTI